RALLVAGRDRFVGPTALRADAVRSRAGVDAAGRGLIAAERLAVAAGEAHAHAAVAPHRAVGLAHAGVPGHRALAVTETVRVVAGIGTVLPRHARWVVHARRRRSGNEQRTAIPGDEIVQRVFRG